MVVTGLHLLGGAVPTPTGCARVRRGRWWRVGPTTEVGADVAVRVDRFLDSSGAERDDDGSVIAARTVRSGRAVTGVPRWPKCAREVVERLHRRAADAARSERSAPPDAARRTACRIGPVRHRRQAGAALPGGPRGVTARRDHRPQAPGTGTGPGSRSAGEFELNEIDAVSLRSRRGRPTRRGDPATVRTGCAARCRADGAGRAVGRTRGRRVRGFVVGGRRRRVGAISLESAPTTPRCGRWAPSSPRRWR